MKTNSVWTGILWALGIGLFFCPAFCSAETYASGDRRDPFTPLVGEKGLPPQTSVKSGEVQIQGIILDPQKGSFALINGQLYQKGDRVDNMEVVNVFADRVVFKIGTEEKTVWYYEEPSPQGDS